MPFNFSFSTSATFVSTSSVNGETKGWAYRRESYNTKDGSGVRTTRQRLGDAPVTQTRVYDAQGRPFLTNGYNNNNNNNNDYYQNNGGGSSRSHHNYYNNNHGYVSRRRGNNDNNNNNVPVGVGKIISIEDVTEEENAKAAATAAAANANAQWNNNLQGKD